MFTGFSGEKIRYLRVKTITVKNNLSLRVKKNKNNVARRAFEVKWVAQRLVRDFGGLFRIWNQWEIIVFAHYEY